MAFKATMREHGVKHAFQQRDAAFGSGYAAIRGFGAPRTGASPYADWPSFDIVSQSIGGETSPVKAPSGAWCMFWA